MQNQGRLVIHKNGNQTFEQDYVKALELYRRLVKEFEKGESRFWEQAQQHIKNITDPQVGVSAGNVFLPDSEIQYYLSWRNVKKIELALYPVELNRDVRLSEGQQNWLQSIDLGSLEKIKSWTRETKDKGDYKPGNETVRIDKLKPGAYVIEAKADGKEARDLILVSDGALVLKTSGKQALVFFANALNSSPIGNAKVKLWEWWHENNSWHVREQSKEAGKDGIAVFDLTHPANHNSLQLFASAIRDDRQAFSTGNSYWYNRQDEPWKIYAFTDRPAYRPKETVNWKYIARRYNGSVYSTPTEQTIEFEITDPRGAKIKSDKAKLNSFGSAWGTVELTEQMPLGEYRVQFWDEGRKNGIGAATLFRLEEYKLPEFKVSVKTPDEDAPNGTKQRKSYKLGDKVEVEIQADYYFGGPVANATVEVLVHQSPFYHYWHEPRDFPWFYDDMDSNSPWGGRGRWNRGYGGDQIIKRESIKTDATGKATLTFDTPKGGGQDLEFRVEARVTDSSRREITGNGNVRVTRQRYYVYANADHNLYRPQDKVHVNFKALDANEQPVQTEGNVKVTRDYWWEIWISPAGKEVKGDELKALRDKSADRIWPPRPTKPNEPGWRLKFRGYEHDDVLTKTLKTDTNGVAEIEFKPERDGYYRISWTSEDKIAKSRSQVANPIKAETTVWVASGATTELGYRHGGVEIIADKDTFRVGQKAPVMLVVPTNDRYVLFTVEGEELYSYQLVHVTGTVKLIELPIEEKHVPNIFLGATLLSDRQMFADSKQIVVPPTKNFLTVDVKPDREQHQPREDGTFTITTRDHEGKPISTEVALSLVDESVFYIQQDYAGDPRQFYFGTKRQQHIQTQATMNHKSYAKLVEGENEQLMDERELERQKFQNEKRKAGTEWSYDYADKDFNGRDGRYDLYDRSESLSVNGVVTGLPLAAAETASIGGGGGAGGRQRLFYGMNAAKAPASRFTGEKESELGALADIPPGTPPPGQEPAVVVRSDFRSTILWQPDIVTDKNGKATVKVKYPDSLTSWKATARAVTAVNQFGIADTTTRTKMPLIVRLQAPRFFVVGDFVVISAVMNNNTDQPLTVQLKLDAEGIDVTGLYENGQPVKGELGPREVPANSEARQDWYVHVSKPGQVKLKVTGRGGKYSDAMEKTFIAHEHGIEKFISKSGKARGNDITVKLELPKERKADSTSLTVQVTPSMAVTMLDALPYLIDYPYGCTEQTMSRFLPAAITAKTLRDLGLQPEDVMGRIFGGIETNTAAATHPKGKRDLAELDAITKASLERLYDFQHGDGGWGWWKQGDSDHWMTAYVVWGLTLAKEAGVKIKPDAIERGVAYLDKTLVEEEENFDMQAWMLHASSIDYHFQIKTRTGSLPPFKQKAFDNLWKNREKLNAYTRSLLALSAHYFGKKDEAKTLIENLENGVKRDERPDQSVLIDGKVENAGVMGIAHWGEDGIYWRWSDGGVEATAFALRALLTIDPKNKLIEPVSNWLIRNRRGAQWSNTRDTAIVVLAMNDYLRVSGELKTDIEYELIVNGSSIAKKKITGADVFNAPSRFEIDPKLIKNANEIRIKTKNNGGSAAALYFAIEGKFFSLEEPITPAGNEIFVKREYYKLVGRPTLLKGHVYDKQPLRDGETVKSGERVETLLTIEAKNNYEYLLFEDLKPAGFEAVEIRSGESLYANELKSGGVNRKFAKGGDPQNIRADATEYTGRNRWVYQELRDRKVALFLDKLPEGVWEIRYDLRAEVPGKFHALPVVGHAMYVPEIRCNGAEVRINVEDGGRD
jgi:alpha-2-macroglobulin